MKKNKTFKNTIPDSPVLTKQSIIDSVLPEKIKKFMIENLPWKEDGKNYQSVVKE